MSKTPTTPQGVEFHLRPGVDPIGGADWRGVNTETDPSSLAPNELQRGDDIRLNGRIILTRSPLIEKINLTTFGGSGKILALKEGPVDNPRVRLWFAEIGCHGVGAGTGGEILQVDPTQLPVVQTYASFPVTSNTQPTLAQFGDTLMGSNGSNLFTVLQISSPPGVASTSILASPPLVSPVDFPGFNVLCMQEFDGKLFVGLGNIATPAASKIMTWDGVTIREDKTGIAPPISMGTWRDKLIVGFEAATGSISVRNIGASPGTYNVFALAGFQSSPYGNAIVEVRQYAYIAGGSNGLIYKFDGAALTLARSLLASEATAVVHALTIYNGLLHYGWYKTAATAGTSYVGRHDPDSTAANEWTDKYKNSLTSDVPFFLYLTSMKAYRQAIYCGGGDVSIVSTALNNLKGTAVSVNDIGAGGANWGLVQIVRFP